MAVTARAFGNGVLFIVNNDIDWVADTIHWALLLDTYTPDFDTHNFFDDVNTHEMSASGGYSAGGVALAGKATSVVAADDRVILDCNDITISFSASKTWRYGVTYKKRGGAASADELIGLHTWDSNQTKSTPHTFTIDASGLFRMPY